MPKLIAGLLLLATVQQVSAVEHAALLRFSGVQDTLDHLADYVIESAVNNAERCASAVAGTAQVRANYQSEILTEIAIETLASRLQPDDGQSALIWFRSSDGQQLYQAEQNPTAPPPAVAGDHRAAVDERRATQLARIADYTGAAHYTALLATEIEYAGARYSGCIELHESASQGTNPERVRARIIRDDKALMAQLFHDSVLEDMDEVLAALPDDVLQRYATFAATPPARKLFIALRQALLASLQAAVARLPDTQTLTEADD